MTYRIDPRRKALQKWHAYANNGIRYLVVNAAGTVLATGRFISDWSIATTSARPGSRIVSVQAELDRLIES
ncbi:hypothetical protein B0F00_24595 [Salmonella enterica subsp. enterica serovar Virchow]|uniref:Uncharacterized protein n=1 Tax=Salmonella virchow TaxID=48409 RepID=A0A603A254_SALVI|nr:hypothetical protein [Salmonella enterica]ECT8541888.1 hypothetical protein [Salmonella enterica subsp. enterica serovar Virchow]EDF4309254.1 hypothetical protein [Salmonella enterica subsp. enterica serovar Virchow]